MPTILGANSVSGYEISNSMRFNRGDAACLRKTFSGSPTSTKKCTISFWTKLADPSNTDAKAIFSAIKSGSNEDVIKFMGVNNSILNALEITFNNTNAGTMMISDGNDTLIKFRDPSAWYHFVIAIDSSQGTASNRVKVYVNGTQHDVEARVEGGSITDDVVLTQDYELGFLTASAHSIGENVESAGNEPYDGYLADFYFVDGQQYAPTVFGETDDNGVWIPKEAKDDISFGNYGFFLEFQQTGTSADASGKGADTSGNDNHFDDANATATDVTTDTPTNNFNTLNPLTNDEQTFSEGNTKTVKGGNAGSFATSTFEVNKGKWYFESKLLNYSGDSRPTVGIAQSHNSYQGTLAGAPNNKAYYLLETSYYRSNAGSAVTVNSSPATNDIYMWGVDLDNLKFYIGKNGSWLHSSDPSAGSNGLAIEVADYYSVATSPNDNGTDNTRNNEWLFNFGNPAYANSSSVSDANGYGDFEYAVPTGFYSYCTKNLADFG